MKGLQKNLILYHTPVQTYTADTFLKTVKTIKKKAITNVLK